MNNMVLVKPRIQNDRVICDSGVELFIDTTYEAEKHTNVVCDVIRVPNQLIFSRKYGNYVTMPHDVDMEVLPGDIAYCDYLAVQNAITNKFDGKGFIENGEIYILIHYQNIFMVLRDDFPIMCNGYVLVEPTYDELELVRLAQEPNMNYGMKVDQMSSILDNIAIENAKLQLIEQYFKEAENRTPSPQGNPNGQPVGQTHPGQTHGE